MSSVSPLESVPLSAPILENIPSTLRALPRWVMWGVQVRGGKITKPPLYVQRNGVYLSSVDDSRRWMTYADAVAGLERYRGQTVTIDGVPPITVAGVGFVLTADDGVTGIDIDHCTTPDGTIAGWADSLIRSLSMAGYVERSPSGTGIRAFTKEPLPPEYAAGGYPDGFKWKDGGIGLEVYTGRRYLTVTGHMVEGSAPDPLSGNLCAPALLSLWTFYTARRPQREKCRADPVVLPLDDSELLDKAYAAKNGAEIRELYTTPPTDGKDPSVEDQRLASMLAFWAGGDAATLDRLMRGSARLQSPDRLQKWDTRHSSDGRTYGQLTIDKALSGLQHTYDGRRGAASMTATEGESIEADITLHECPTVPRGIFPSSVEDAIEDIADKMTGGAYAVAFGGFLGGVAAAVRAKRSIAVSTATPQPLILWLCNVAPSGSGKTGAARVWEQPLLDGDICRIEAYNREYTDYKKALVRWKATPPKDRAGDAPEAPAYPPRAVMGDTTLEALTQNLRAYDAAGGTACTTIFSDELRMGMRSLDCYSGGNAGTGLPALLTMYDMGAFINSRVIDQSRNFAIRRAGLSLYGGLQTGLIGDVFTPDMIKSGGFGRWAFTLATAPEHKDLQTEGLTPATKATVSRLMDYLIRLPEPGDGGGVIPVTPDAKALFSDWYRREYDRAYAAGQTDFVDKASKLASRLALAIYLIDLAMYDSTPPAVDADIMGRALRLTAYFQQTQERVLAYALGKGATVQPRDRTAARILISHREEIEAARGRVSSSRLLQWLRDGGLELADRQFGGVCSALHIGSRKSGSIRLREITAVAWAYMEAITSTK